jgi:hypothetical protein
MTRSIPVLVYGELSEVAHELLGRRGLELRWAMTLEEALAVNRQVPIELAITTDPYAREYLKHREGLESKSPCIVVVDQEGREIEYLAAGATVVATPETILEAVSELTGLAFRMHPRLELQTVVDVQIDNQNYFLTTIDVSASGVAIAGFPNAQYGARADLRFDMFDPPLLAQAMVVRTFQRDEQQCAGLCFVDMAWEDRARLRMMIERDRAETSEMTELHRGKDTQDLLALLREDADGGVAEYVRMLMDTVAGRSTSMPSWLRELANELTVTERSAIERGDHSWARAAVGMRVELRRRLIDAANAFDARAALDLCRAIAIETRRESDQAASDATIIRAHVLRDASRIHRQEAEV